jgi:hypothetical protein
MTGQRPAGRPGRVAGYGVRGRPRPGSARGAVTAEFAVALPAVLLLLALLLAGAARALARGESPAAAEAIVSRLAGASATAAIAADGEWVSVTVADRVAGPLVSTVPWTLTAKASSRSETAGANRPSGPEPALAHPLWSAADA